MSAFHDRLVTDRREGKAPPQLAQMTEAKPTPDTVDFTDLADLGAPSACLGCGSVVPEGLQRLHAEWHAAPKK